MKIQRLGLDGDEYGGAWLSPDDDGDWVTYEDHLTLLSRYDKLLEAFEKYGSHLGGCGTEWNKKCDCGFNDAVSSVENNQ